MTSPFSRIFPFLSARFLVIAALICALPACSSVKTEPKYADKSREEMYKNGSLASDEGGFSLLGGKDSKKADNNGIGVNGFLWRASLDTLSFMPIAAADPFGGVITTDWYSAPDAPNERVKLNVLILDRDLRADGVKVTTFREVRDPKGAWRAAPVAEATNTSLEETILTRARQIKLAQKEMK